MEEGVWAMEKAMEGAAADGGAGNTAPGVPVEGNERPEFLTGSPAEESEESEGVEVESGRLGAGGAVSGEEILGVGSGDGVRLGVVMGQPAEEEAYDLFETDQRWRPTAVELVQEAEGVHVEEGIRVRGPAGTKGIVGKVRLGRGRGGVATDTG